MNEAKRIKRLQRHIDSLAAAHNERLERLEAAAGKDASSYYPNGAPAGVVSPWMAQQLSRLEVWLDLYQESPNAFSGSMSELVRTIARGDELPTPHPS